MSEKLSENLNFLMSEARLTAEELSRRIGLPASTIKKARNKCDSNPTLSTLTPIAKYFSLSISQLIGDEPFPKSRAKGAYQINQETLCHIPVISWQEAIHWPDTEKQFHSTIMSEYVYGKHAYALLVVEEDWENLAKDTVLLVDPTLAVDHRDFIIVYKNGQKTPTLKQALFDEEEMYLKPIEEGYNVAVFTPEHKILGVVVEYKKQLKKINVENSEEN
ncbi:MAG: helix-turn-helix domain-containing protein [Gammaproteobacteria bacterium]|nr:MAG: helix-turn-helix domain-containing protein [Gammaproteobacteria bacterium]